MVVCKVGGGIPFSWVSFLSSFLFSPLATTLGKFLRNQIGKGKDRVGWTLEFRLAECMPVPCHIAQIGANCRNKDLSQKCNADTRQSSAQLNWLFHK